LKRQANAVPSIGDGVGLRRTDGNPRFAVAVINTCAVESPQPSLEWTPALRAAGLEHRRVYDMRHTFATWEIESGVHLWHLATIMGTSVVQLEDSYARWLKRTDDQLRATFDAYDAVVGA
jgi:hypothetical protein